MLSPEEHTTVLRSFEVDRLLKLVTLEAKRLHDGHFSILAFTTEHVMTTPPSRTFRSWLRAQRHRQDAVGDLARDVQQDRCLTARTLPGMRRHLTEDHAACEHACAALERAYHEWTVVAGGHTHDRG
jgi:hypothetical protein